MVDWDKLTKDDITINYMNGWERRRETDDKDAWNVPGGFIIGWSCKGVGFGTLTLNWDGNGFTADAENMDKAFCMLVMEKVLENCGIK